MNFLTRVLNAAKSSIDPTGKQTTYNSLHPMEALGYKSSSNSNLKALYPELYPSKSIGIPPPSPQINYQMPQAFNPQSVAPQVMPRFNAQQQTNMNRMSFGGQLPPIVQNPAQQVNNVQQGVNMLSRQVPVFNQPSPRGFNGNYNYTPTPQQLGQALMPSENMTRMYM